MLIASCLQRELLLQERDRYRRSFLLPVLLRLLNYDCLRVHRTLFPTETTWTDLTYRPSQYLLFWNVLWTLIPVLAIGIFDQAISQSVLMQVPELYRYGREGHWFGLVRFSWYMIDGVYQV